MAGSEDMLQQFFYLSQQELHQSAAILGSLMLANLDSLGLEQQSCRRASVLWCYAEGLFEGMQYQRALHYYKDCLNSLQHLQDPTDEGVPSAEDVKWKVYKCHLKLSQEQEALEMLASTPVLQRSPKVSSALARLYLTFKNDNKSALACYKEVLRACPLALDAVLGVLKLETNRSELEALAKSYGELWSKHANLKWLDIWLQAQSCVTSHDFKGAATAFQKFEKQGFGVPADTTSDMAACMLKLGKKSEAEELFAKARAQDEHVLKHMDAYARVVAFDKLERLSSELLYSSSCHAEPWVAKAWHHSKNKQFTLAERTKANIFLQKAISFGGNAEASFLQASLCFANQGFRLAVQKYSEAIQLDPSFFEAYEALIRCYLEARSDKEALSLARVAKKYIKQPAYQYYLEGIALSQKPSSLSRAITALQKAVEVEKGFEKGILILSNLYIQDGKAEKAVQMLSKQLQRHPSAVLHAELGSCYTRLKRFQEAMEQYVLALRKDPFLERAQQSLDLLRRGADQSVMSVAAGEGEAVLGAGNLEGLEMESDDSIPVMDLANQEYQWS